MIADLSANYVERFILLCGASDGLHNNRYKYADLRGFKGRAPKSVIIRSPLIITDFGEADMTTDSED